MIRAITTQGNPATILARVLDQTGTPITQSSVSSVSVTVYNAETSTSTGSSTPAVADCVFNTLQTGDSRWSTDHIGFNLAVDVDGTALNVGDTTFQVQIEITPAAGEPYRLIAIVETREIFD